MRPPSRHNAATPPQEAADIAMEAIRSLLEKIALTPWRRGTGCSRRLHGELGAILEWAGRRVVGRMAKTQKPAAVATGLLVYLVAGARFELTTFRL